MVLREIEIITGRTWSRTLGQKIVSEITLHDIQKADMIYYIYIRPSSLRTYLIPSVMREIVEKRRDSFFFSGDMIAILFFMSYYLFKVIIIQ